MSKKPRYRFPNHPQGSIAEKIKRRRLQILIHSCIYYVLDDNIIADDTFDTWSKELVKLMKENPDAYSDRCDKEFKDWDGATGYDLRLRDPWVISTAQYILNLERNKK